jgi:hypothetical protein
MSYEVVIPTHKPNRERLTATLKSIPSCVQVNLVENGSDYLKSFSLPSNIKLFIRDKPSANAARNFGWMSHNKQYTLFTDDDIVFPSTYFDSLEHILNNNPTDVFGGPVHLIDPPDWIIESFAKTLAELKWESWIPGASNIMTLARVHGHYLVGANMCVRNDFLRSIHGFDEKFGYQANLVSNDEHHVIDKAKTFKYYTDLTVLHDVRHRYNIEYLLKRYKGQGIADCRYYAQYESSAERFYNQSLYMANSLFSVDEINKVRNTLKNEEKTLEYIKQYVLCKNAYLNSWLEEIEYVY